MIDYCLNYYRNHYSINHYYLNCHFIINNPHYPTIINYYHNYLNH